MNESPSSSTDAPNILSAKSNGHSAGVGVSYGGLDSASVRDRCTLLGIEWAEDAPQIDPEAVAAITAEVAVRLRVVPVRFDGNRLVVAMVDPLDIAAADEIAALAGRAVTRIGLEQETFSELMRQNYGTTAARWLKAWQAKPRICPQTSNIISTPSRRMTSTEWPSSPR